MASQWFYKAHADHERQSAKRGPVSFQQLAQFVADGELTSDSVACRETGEEWQPVNQIVGLRRLVDKIHSRSLERPSSHPPEDAAATTGGPETVITVPTSGPAFDHQATADEKSYHWRQQLAIGLASVVVFVFLVGWWVRPRWERFPKPAGLQTTQHVSDWYFPLIGRVSRFEFGLLALDVVIVLLMIIWWLRNRTSRKRQVANCGSSQVDPGD